MEGYSQSGLFVDLNTGKVSGSTFNVSEDIQFVDLSGVPMPMAASIKNVVRHYYKEIASGSPVSNISHLLRERRIVSLDWYVIQNGYRPVALLGYKYSEFRFNIMIVVCENRAGYCYLVCRLYEDGSYDCGDFITEGKPVMCAAGNYFMHSYKVNVLEKDELYIRFVNNQMEYYYKVSEGEIVYSGKWAIQ